jgi:hypothetical protein
MHKRNAISVAASVALVSLAGAATVGTTLADGGAPAEPAPAVTTTTRSAAPVLAPATFADDDRVASGDDQSSRGDDHSSGGGHHGHGRGRGRGHDGDDD